MIWLYSTTSVWSDLLHQFLIWLYYISVCDLTYYISVWSDYYISVWSDLLYQCLIWLYYTSVWSDFTVDQFYLTFYISVWSDFTTSVFDLTTTSVFDLTTIPVFDLALLHQCLIWLYSTTWVWSDFTTSVFELTLLHRGYGNITENHTKCLSVDLQKHKVENGLLCEMLLKYWHFFRQLLCLTYCLYWLCCKIIQYLGKFM